MYFPRLDKEKQNLLFFLRNFLKKTVLSLIKTWDFNVMILIYIRLTQACEFHSRNLWIAWRAGPKRSSSISAKEQQF